MMCSQKNVQVCRPIAVCGCDLTAAVLLAWPVPVFSKEQICKPLGGSGLGAAVAAQSVFSKEQVRQIQKMTSAQADIAKTDYQLIMLSLQDLLYCSIQSSTCCLPESTNACKPAPPPQYQRSVQYFLWAESVTSSPRPRPGAPSRPVNQSHPLVGGI